MKNKLVARIRFFLGLFFLLGLAGSALAQQVNDGNQTGFPPYGSFHGSSFDSISINGGNLHVEIPIINLSQRGGRQFAWRFIYDTPVWELKHIPSPNPRLPGQWVVTTTDEGAKWRLADPFIWNISYQSVLETCPGTSQQYWKRTNWRLTDPDGTKHPLPFRREDGMNCQGSLVAGPTLDGTGIFVDASNYPATPLIILKDGTRVAPSWRDSNGNLASSAVDMLNRVPVQVVNGPWVNYTTPLGFATSGPQYTQWIVKDSDGNSQVYQVDYTAIDILTSACGSPYAVLAPCYEYSARWIVPLRVTLPTGKFFQFTWQNNGFGDLLKIDLPTGGHTAYGYVTKYFKPRDAGHKGPHTARRSAASRTINDGTSSSTWSYSYATGGTTITNPDGNQESHTLAYIGNPDTWGDTRVVTEVRHFDGSSGSGTLLRTLTKEYAAELNPVSGYKDANLRVIRETTTLETGQTSKIETDYETFQYAGTNTATRMNVLETREFDYGLELKRRTTYTFQHTGNQAYLDRNIVNRVKTVVVKDGSGTIASQTANEYDIYTANIQGTNAVQHDPAFGTGFTIRGNVTAVSGWRNTDGAWLTARNQYDDVGNVISITDPLAHTTSFNYDDSWANAACAPSAGSGRAYRKSLTNAVGHLAVNSYYSCTGLAASMTDANLQTASFTYDKLNRLDMTTLPDGGESKLAYSDTATNPGVRPGPWIRTKRLLSPGIYVVSYSLFDGLGRPWRVEKCEDGTDNCTESIKADTVYDSMGRVRKASNPYRADTESTFGWTETHYDALSRPIRLIPPDGSASGNNMNTSYLGSATTVTDQTGKKQKGETDALGRLIRIWEPDAGGSFVYETVYQYDILDNLTRVEQKGNDSNSANWRTRTFTYNSLSHLLSATNPETGAISYAYEDDGNLISKTDARGIVTTMAYDALHRVLTKAYSDSTPIATFTYDLASVDGLSIQFPKGRLVKAATPTTRTVLSYDSLGRVKDHWQCTPANCGSGWFQMTYGYNELGAVTSQTNPMGFTLMHQFDGASRPTQLVSSWSDAEHPGTLASGVTYNPAGALIGVDLGNGLVESWSYNNRLQPTQARVRWPSCPPMMQCYDELQLNYSFTNAQGQNNGNVVSWSATSFGSTMFGRTYTYDELNRLKAMSSPGESCLGLTWEYDIWGNRLSQTGTGGTCNDHLPTISPSTNRIVDTGFTYDAAGNLTYNPAPVSQAYAYDAEGRMISINNGCVENDPDPCYSYDANGHRIRKKIDSTITDYIYDVGGALVAERQSTTGGSNWTWTKGYVYFNGWMLVQYDGVLGSGGATTYFAHKDHLGSTRLLSTSTGGMHQVYDYLPFGEPIIPPTPSPASSAATSNQFTGQQRDPESALDYFGMRFYVSAAGRFSSPDRPFMDQSLLSPQTWNLYMYARNNPLTFVDQWGGQSVLSNIQIAHFLYVRYWLVSSNSILDILLIGRVKSAGRGSGWGGNKKTGVYAKDPGSEGDSLADFASALGAGVGRYAFLRLITRAYFASFTIFINKDGQEEIQVTITAGDDNDPNRPMQVGFYSRSVEALSDPSGIVSILGHRNLYDRTLITDAHLAALLKEARRSGFDELVHVLLIEEARRRRQDEEAKKKKEQQQPK